MEGNEVVNYVPQLGQLGQLEGLTNLVKRETWKRIRSVGESWFFVEVSIIKPTDSLTDLFVALSSFPKLTNSLSESTVSFL